MRREVYFTFEEGITREQLGRFLDFLHSEGIEYYHDREVILTSYLVHHKSIVIDDVGDMYCANWDPKEREYLKVDIRTYVRVPNKKNNSFKKGRSIKSKI